MSAPHLNGVRQDVGCMSENVVALSCVRDFGDAQGEVAFNGVGGADSPAGRADEDRSRD